MKQKKERKWKEKKKQVDSFLKSLLTSIASL